MLRREWEPSACVDSYKLHRCDSYCREIRIPQYEGDFGKHGQRTHARRSRATLFLTLGAVVLRWRAGVAGDCARDRPGS